MTKRFSRLAVLALALLGAVASSPQAIEWPRVGRPAVLVPGGLLEVGAREEGTLSLELDGQVTPLNTNWSPAPGAVRRGRATVPEGTTPGRYALQLASSSGITTRTSAVHILAEIPEDYNVAIIRSASPVDGAAEQAPLPTELSTRLRDAQVQMVLMLGPLTRNGSEEEYQALESALSSIDLPVYLCPDNKDLRGGHYRARFGDPIYGATFGRDGFLFLGGGLPAEDPRARESLGGAYLLRRALRASRWSIGVAGRFGLDWDLHAQIALFVDDPLNALIVGAVAPGLGATVPWGKTAFVLPEEAPSEPFTVIGVTATGIRPRKESEPEKAPAADQVEVPAE